MAELINLRQLRKQKARTENDKQAEANRQKFGRTKAEKELSAAEQDRAMRTLDGHKRGES